MESGSGNNDTGSTRYETENIDDLDFDDLNGVPKDEDRTGLGFDDMNFDYDTDSDEDQFYGGGDLVIDEGSLAQNHNRNETNTMDNNDDDDCEIIGIKTSPTLTSNTNTNINTTTLPPNGNGVPSKKIIIIYKMNKNSSNNSVINSLNMNMNMNNDNGNHHRKQNINDGIVNPDLPLPPKPKVPSQKHIDFLKKYSNEFKPRPPTEEELNDYDNDETEDQELPTLDRQEVRALEREMFLAEKEDEIVRNLMRSSGLKRVRCNQCLEMFYGPNSESALRAHIFQDHFDNKVRQFESFAETFKRKRIKLGYTQGDVGQALGNMYGSDFSQTTISRFEALNLSFNNMSKIEPILRKWLEDAENAAATGTSAESNSSTMWPDIFKKKRKKRTSIEQHAYDTLEKVFLKNQKLTSEELSLLADNLDMEKEVVRVWFCNRRQKEKRLNPEGEFLPPGETIAAILGQTTSRPRKRSLSPGPPHLEPMVPFPTTATTTRTAKVPTTSTSTSYTAKAKVPSSASTSSSSSATKVSSISTSSATKVSTTSTSTTTTVSVPVTRPPGSAKLYAITKPPPIPISKSPTESPKDNKENASTDTSAPPNLSLVKTEPEDNMEFRIDSIYSSQIRDFETASSGDQDKSELAPTQSPRLQVYSNKRKRLTLN